MASLLSSTAAAASSSVVVAATPSLPQSSSFPKPFSLTAIPHSRRSVRCNGIFTSIIPEDLLDTSIHLAESNPAIVQLQTMASSLPEVERWEFLAVFGLTWIYLTARPGVLLGAMDAYLLAPLQLVFDSLLGRRNFKMKDFIVGVKLGEGSFGVVYDGAIVPKNVSMEDRVGRRSMRVRVDDDRFKQKVILKKV